MVTKKQKPIVDTQKVKRKKFKCTTMENHQITEEGKRKRKKGDNIFGVRLQPDEPKNSTRKNVEYLPLWGK